LLFFHLPLAFIPRLNIGKGSFCGISRSRIVKTKNHIATPLKTDTLLRIQILPLNQAARIPCKQAFSGFGVFNRHPSLLTSIFTSQTFARFSRDVRAFFRQPVKCRPLGRASIF